MPAADPQQGFEIAQFIAPLGVGGIIAALIFMFYRKDMKQYADLWQAQSEMYRKDMKEYTAIWQAHSQTLIILVKETTVAITEMTQAVKSLHRRNDRIDEGLAQLGVQAPPHRTKPRDGEQSEEGDQRHAR